MRPNMQTARNCCAQYLSVILCLRWTLDFVPYCTHIWRNSPRSSHQHSMTCAEVWQLAANWQIDSLTRCLQDLRTRAKHATHHQNWQKPVGYSFIWHFWTLRQAQAWSNASKSPSKTVSWRIGRSHIQDWMQYCLALAEFEICLIAWLIDWFIIFCLIVCLVCIFHFNWRSCAYKSLKISGKQDWVRCGGGAWTNFSEYGVWLTCCCAFTVGLVLWNPKLEAVSYCQSINIIQHSFSPVAVDVARCSVLQMTIADAGDNCKIGLWGATVKNLAT